MQQATIEDVADIVELDYLLFPENNFNEVTIGNELALGHGWVVREEGKLIAYALLRRDGDLLDLLRLGVHPKYRRRGLGHKLLDSIFEANQKAMLTVKKENKPALRLYIKHGFEIVGHTAGNEAWIMRR